MKPCLTAMIVILLCLNISASSTQSYIMHRGKKIELKRNRTVHDEISLETRPSTVSSDANKYICTERLDSLERARAYVHEKIWPVSYEKKNN